MSIIRGLSWASLVTQRLKRLPAMWETWVRSLGWKDYLEKEMATPLQYSCLENPMDRGAWWATVHGVTKSRTQLTDFTFTFSHFQSKIWHNYIMEYSEIAFKKIYNY